MPQYVGRFAPSPSGRLHFGSLICAVGSYLQARSVNGKILLRIEDLDSYRCSKELTSIILDELTMLGFEYDEPPYIQSEHTDVYLSVANKLLQSNQAFYCQCTRAYLKEHECLCSAKQLIQTDTTHYSLKYPIPKEHESTFKDELRGLVQYDIVSSNLTLIRSDKIISYNLACVVDDILQGVTQVVRGADLIDITPSQMCLYKTLGHEYVSYLHLPLAMEDDKYKLSKQNHAKAVFDVDTPSNLLIQALRFLNQDCSDYHSGMKPQEILSKAIDRYQPTSIPITPKLSPIL